MTSPVLVTIDAGVAELRFNRPDRLNALDLETTTAFRDAVEQVLTDETVRVVILSGEGRAFVAGGDLAYLRNAADRPAAARALIAPIHEGLLRLSGSGLPTIAALQGAVAGAGMSLALFTDLAVAAENVKFNMSYIKVAANPDCGGSWTLVRLVGHRKAAELTLLSETVDAVEALRLGLVNRVVPLEALADTVAEMARRIAAGPPGATRRTRVLFDQAPATSLGDQLAAELEGFALGAGSEDFGEALEAFFGKRAAIFTGR